MNYEDRFVPREADEDLYIENDNKLFKSMQDNQGNKHHHRVVKRIKTKLGRRTINIEYFSSGPIGTTITHAVSGVKQRGNIVGSVHEDLFFKVSIVNGNGPVTLFYYSPEEYEKHQYITLSDAIKSKWNEQYLKITLMMNAFESE